jgi:hypothetical protein
MPDSPRILLAFALALLPSMALADMSFYVVNDHPRDIAFEFVGKDRAWPGDDQVYALEGNHKKSVPIDCEEGERICYGAWEVGNDKVLWGIGPDRDKACEDCCHTCLSTGNANVTISD